MEYAVISPTYPDLPDLAAAANAMAGALECEPLTGDVSPALFRQHLRGQRLAGLYIGAHASADGLRLSNNQQLSALALAGILKNCMRRGGWVFVSACDSATFLATIQRTAVVAVAASIVVDLPDGPAADLEQNIADALRSNGRNFAQAVYDLSLQVLPYFRYWPHPGAGVIKSMYQDDGDMHRTAVQQLADIRQTIEQMKEAHAKRLGALERWAAEVSEIVDGADKWGWAGVRSEFQKLQVALAEMEDKLEEALGSIQLDVQAALSSTSRPPGFVERHRWKFMLAFLVIIGLVTVLTYVAVVQNKV